MDLDKLNEIKMLAKEIQGLSREEVREKAKRIERLASQLIRELEKLLILEMYL